MQIICEIVEAGKYNDSAVWQQAGGATSNGRMSILDIKPEKADLRAPVFIGSTEDVSRSEEYLNYGKTA